MIAPKVTVLMPAYNAERYVLKAVDSILNQTFTDFELLVIDDGSTDATRAVLSRVSDSRIRVLSNHHNLGLMGTLNRGLAEACSVYVARLDADDVSMPTRLEKQVAILDGDPTVGLVAGLLEGMDQNERTIWTQAGWKPSPEELHYRLIFRNHIGHSTVLYRRELALKLGGYALRQCEDWDLWAKMSTVCKVVMVPEVMCRWRQLQTGIQATSPTDVVDFEKVVFAQNLARISDGRLSSARLVCFHNNAFPGREHARISATSLVELRKLHKLLCGRCPSYLDESAMSSYCSRAFSEAVRGALCDYALLAIPSRRLRKRLRNRWATTPNVSYW